MSNFKHASKYDPKTNIFYIPWSQTNVIEDSSEEYCIIYTRVSSRKQMEEWDGIETQKTTCEERARRNNIILLEFFSDEAISWAEINRPWFEDAIKFLKKENKNHIKIKYFVCTELSRIVRSSNMVEVYSMVDKITATGCKVQTISGHIDTSTNEWKFFNTIKHWMAWYERDIIAQRTKNNMRWRMLQWDYVFTPPAWYKYEKENQVIWKKSNSHLIKNEFWDLIGKWLSMYANGELLSRKDLHTFLDEWGCKTNAQYLRPKKLHKQFIDRLFDPVRLFLYSGYIVYPERWIVEPVEAKHEPIITLQTAKKIITLQQDKQTEKSKTVRKDVSKDMPLRWLLICSCCQRKLTWWRSKGKLGKKYLYYRCQSEECEEKTNISGPRLHKEFRELLQSVSPSQEIMNIYEILFHEILENKLGVQVNLIKKKEKQMAQIQKQIDQITEKILAINNPVLVQDIEKKYVQLQNDLQKIEQSIAEIQEKQEGYSENIEPLMEILKNPVSIWDIEHIELKKLLLACLFGGSISYNKKTGYWTHQIPLYNWYFSTLTRPNNWMGNG